MPGLITAVQQNTDSSCYSRNIKKKGCSVSLANIPKKCLCIDLDAKGSPLQGSDKKCDYLVFSDCSKPPDFLAAIELKSGRLDASDATQQLQAGANCAEKLVPKNYDVSFCPAVFYVNVHTAQWQKIRKAKVKFRGRWVAVKPGKCGSDLMKCCFK